MTVPSSGRAVLHGAAEIQHVLAAALVLHGAAEMQHVLAAVLGKVMAN